MSRPFVGCCAPSGWRCGTLGVMNLLTVTCSATVADADAQAIKDAGIEVVKIDSERHLIAVKGAVPGAPGGNVVIRPAVKAK